MRRSRPAWLAKGKTRTLRDSKGALVAVPERMAAWNGASAIGRARWIPSVAAGLLVALVITPFAIGEGGRAALAAAVKDPASLFAQRSPGERAPGAMHSTKLPRLASAQTLPGPRERVLPNERVREPAGPLDEVPETGLPIIDAPIEVVQSAPPAAAVPFARPFSPGMVIPGPDPGPGPGPGPGSGPGPGPGPDPEPPLPPIPEPSTWAMLLAGFFTIGAALRRRARGRSAQPASQHASG